MVTIRNFHIYLILFGICSCSPKNEHSKYFTPPDNVIFLNSNTDGFNYVLKNTESNICLDFESDHTAEDIISTIQKLGAHRTCFYFHLKNGNYLYFGFPLTDMHQSHPWYKISIDENYQLSRADESFACYDIQISSNNYTLNGSSTPLNGIDQILENNQRQCVVNIMLSRDAKYSDLDRFLSLLRKHDIYQYMIINKVIKGK